MIKKEFIILSVEAKKERIQLLNTVCKKVLSPEESARLEFLNKLFEMEQKHFTINDIKKDTNKLYSGYKNIKSHYSSKGNNNLYNSSIDLMNSSILQLDYKIVNKYFNFCYDFIKGNIYKECIRVENWVTSLN